MVGEEAFNKVSIPVHPIVSGQLGWDWGSVQDLLVSLKANYNAIAYKDMLYKCVLPNLTKKFWEGQYTVVIIKRPQTLAIYLCVSVVCCHKPNVFVHAANLLSTAYRMGVLGVLQWLCTPYIGFYTVNPRIIGTPGKDFDYKKYSSIHQRSWS